MREDTCIVSPSGNMTHSLQHGPLSLPLLTLYLQTAPPALVHHRPSFTSKRTPFIHTFHTFHPQRPSTPYSKPSIHSVSLRHLWPCTPFYTPLFRPSQLPCPSQVTLLVLIPHCPSWPSRTPLFMALPHPVLHTTVHGLHVGFRTKPHSQSACHDPVGQN